MIDGILALGHFCESHGPCVLLCTQRYEQEPLQSPHSLTVLWCEACQSIGVQQSLISREAKACFVTTRTPIQQDLAFLLKQAVVRSLSCEEETSKDGSTIYFGDNERGHVLSYTFALQDSLARGFYRKYCILILMRDKVHLLNAWPVLTKHIKEVASELQNHAKMVNGTEQEKQSQRAVRQAQGSPAGSARSLSQLTMQPAVFAHIHLWFCWILNRKVATEKTNISSHWLQSIKPFALLRTLLQEIGEIDFNKIVYCCISGIHIECEPNLLTTIKMLLPDNWPAISTETKCAIRKSDKWLIEWTGILPKKLPTFQTLSLKALANSQLPDAALELHLRALILQWHNINKSISYCGSLDKLLLQSFNVQNCDLPLLIYWMFYCVPSIHKYQSIIESLNRILVSQ